MKKLAVIKRTMLTLGLAAAMLATPIAGSVTTASAANSSVKIDAKHFPDKTFRKYVKEFDKDKNGSLSKAERAKVKEINVWCEGITSLKGVEYFTNLTTLNCSSNQLKKLEVSRNINLKELNCSSNQLKKLDVSRNTNLKELDCSDNQLKKLDVSKNTNLKFLACGLIQLSTLDISKNTKLEYLSCTQNQLKKLDVSKNTNLKYLNCSDNKLKKLDVSKNTKLEALFCEENQISTLDVSNCGNLDPNDFDCDSSVQVIGYKRG